MKDKKAIGIIIAGKNQIEKVNNHYKIIDKKHQYYNYNCELLGKEKNNITELKRKYNYILKVYKKEC